MPVAIGGEDMPYAEGVPHRHVLGVCRFLSALHIVKCGGFSYPLPYPLIIMSETQAILIAVPLPVAREGRDEMSVVFKGAC